MNAAIHYIAHRAAGVIPGFYAFSVILLWLFASSAFAEERVRLDVLALSAQDQKAVVRTAAGEMKAVGAGDVLAEEKLTVDKVMPDKLVLKDNTNNDEVWISVAEKGQASAVTRLSKTIENREMPKPVTIHVPLDANNKQRSQHGQ